MGKNELIRSILELPIEDRVAISDILLQSLNKMDSEIEELWTKEVERRVKLLDKGELETISYDEFFNED